MKTSFFARCGVVLTSAFLLAFTLFSFLPGGQASAHTLAKALAPDPPTCSGETCNGLLPQDTGCLYNQVNTMPVASQFILASSGLVGMVFLVHALAPCNAYYAVVFPTNGITPEDIAAGIARTPAPNTPGPRHLFVDLAQFGTLGISRMVGDGTEVTGSQFTFGAAGSIRVGGQNFNATAQLP